MILGLRCYGYGPMSKVQTTCYLAWSFSAGVWLGNSFFPMVVANVLKLSQVSFLLIDVSNFQSSSIELELMVMLGNSPCSCRSYLNQIGRTSISYWFLFVVWNGIGGQISAWFAISVCNDLVRTSVYAHSNSKCGNILFLKSDLSKFILVWEGWNYF